MNNQEVRESRKIYLRNYYRTHLSEWKKYAAARNRSSRYSYQQAWKKEQMASNKLFKLKIYLRNRMWVALRSGGFKKKCLTIEMLGGDIPIVKQWIESKFSAGMTWENYGKWHIDHIIPLASAKTEKELNGLFHHTNLQPLWAADNFRKGSRLW